MAVLLVLTSCIHFALKCTKFHKILKFKQSPWLKSYIDFNSLMRAQADNEFDEKYYKLMNKAVFGKTMQNDMLTSN